MNNYRKTWDTYTKSWKSTKLSEKIEFFKQSLTPICTYTDPLASTQDWDSLVEYMEDFHKQVPGGYFETVDFMAHHNKSLVKWNMLNQTGNKIGDGYSFAKYDDEGLLVEIVGFYKV